MTDSLERRLARAGEDLWSMVEQVRLLPVEPRAPSLRRPMIAVGVGAVAAASALAISSTNRISLIEPAQERVIASPAQHLGNEVITIASEYGWDLSVQTVSSDPSEPDRGVAVRLQDDSSGTVLVSLTLSDPAGVAAGTSDRSGLIYEDDQVSVYLGTDSEQATAVELFTSSSILYLRSESAVYRAPAELAQMAIEVLAAWESRGA